jgi:lauroyl/myristoyl acyltransferase
VNVQSLFHTRRLTSFGLWMARVAPSWVGYLIAKVVSWLFALFRPELFRVLEGNLRHVLGEDAHPRSVSRVAREAYEHAGRTYWDFYRALGSTDEELRKSVTFDGDLAPEIDASRAVGQGVLVLAMHMSNFDLAGLALGVRGYHAQALSLANPPSGFELLNEVRRRSGHSFTPISPASLRKAVRHLRAGGLVITGVDRPVYDVPPSLELFGDKSYLSLGTAKLALMTGAKVILVACCWQDGGYQLVSLPPTEMVHVEDQDEAIRRSSERIARQVEELISETPSQWLMFYPMWPDVERRSDGAADYSAGEEA